MHPAWAGAGGNWPAVNEVLDLEVIRQENQLACGAACGQMLLREGGVNVTQRAITEQTGVPITAFKLAEVMNSFEQENKLKWVGGLLGIPGATQVEVFETLNTTGSWIAMLWETGAKIGHMVIVDELSSLKVSLEKYVFIRDPWGGTKYKMKQEDFLLYWTNYGVYRKK